MKFTELTVYTKTEGSELVADIFWNYTNYGVTICDVEDIISILNDGKVVYDYVCDEVNEQIQKGGAVLVKCYIPVDTATETIPQIRADIEELSVRAKDYLDLGSLEMITREIEGDDWIEIWKKHFKPIHFGKIVICPEWISYSPNENEKVIKLDSNMAFGTGEHETTSMCIQLIEKYVDEDDVVIDVGCGSGILGISAVKLGAKKSYLTDIDYVAVKSAEHNSEINGTADKTDIMLANLLDKTEVKGDLVVANIMAEILCDLAPGTTKNLSQDGVLILSGIIHSRKQMVVDKYAEFNLELVDSLTQGEWNALVFKFKK